MNSKQYYKIGAYMVGMMCITLLLLIFQSIMAQPRQNNRQEPMTLAQELRAYRQVLYDIQNSKNPAITSDLKEKCEEDLDEINSLIDSYENGEAEEISLRTKFDVLTKRLLNDPYLSATTKGGKQLLNAKLDI